MFTLRRLCFFLLHELSLARITSLSLVSISARINWPALLVSTRCTDLNASGKWPSAEYHSPPRIYGRSAAPSVISEKQGAHCTDANTKTEPRTGNPTKFGPCPIFADFLGCPTEKMSSPIMVKNDFADGRVRTYALREK